MQEVNTLAAGLSTYGIYTVIACLIIAITYLFKTVKHLHHDIQNILINCVKEQAELTVKCTKAFEENSRALERLENLINNRNERENHNGHGDQSGRY